MQSGFFVVCVGGDSWRDPNVLRGVYPLVSRIGWNPLAGYRRPRGVFVYLRMDY